MIYNQNISSMLLGCLLKNPQVVFNQAYAFERNLFECEKLHEIIFVAIRKLATQGATECSDLEICNVIEPSKKATGIFEDSNGLEYLSTIRDLCVLENIEVYYQTVAKLALVRELKNNGYNIEKFYNELEDKDYTGKYSFSEIIDYYQGFTAQMRNKYDKSFEREEIQGGENVEELLADFKDKPAMGACLQSGYLTTITNGWSQGHLFLRAGSSGTGKALPNNTIIPTPKGNRTVGEIKVGDYLFDRHKQPTKVLGVFPQGEKEIWEILYEDLDDCKIVRSCYEHLWNIATLTNTNEKTFSLEEIYNNFYWKSEPIYLPIYNKEIDSFGKTLYGKILAITNTKVKTPMTCFLVDNEEHLFLTENYVVTHNSRTSVADLMQVGSKYLWDEKEKDFIENPNFQNAPTLYINTEMELNREVHPMFLACVSGVEYRDIVQGITSDKEDKRIIKAGEIIKESGLTLCSMPNFTERTLEEKIVSHKKQFGTKFCVFDYMELTSSLSTEYKLNNSNTPRQDLILLSLATKLKAIAEDNHIGILTSQQLNDSWKTSTYIDDGCLAGGKATKFKLDQGTIIVPTSYLKNDMKELEISFNKRNRKFGVEEIPKPNICEFIFKTRYSIYGDQRLKLWSYFDKGTFRRYDYFVTDDENNILDIKPTFGCADG